MSNLDNIYFSVVNHDRHDYRRTKPRRVDHDYNRVNETTE